MNFDALRIAYFRASLYSFGFIEKNGKNALKKSSEFSVSIYLHIKH